jgi:hypothetical protein
MDLLNYDPVAASDKGAPLHLRNPLSGELLFFPVEGDEEPVPIVLTILGNLSTRVKKELKATTKDLEAELITPEEQGTRLLMAAIAGWEGELPVNGENLKYSQENVRKIVNDPRMEWVVAQVGNFSMAPANFARNVENN